MTVHDLIIHLEGLGFAENKQVVMRTANGAIELEPIYVEEDTNKVVVFLKPLV